MESLKNGYRSLTFGMQKKFLTLGNSSLRNRSCVNNLSFIKNLNYYKKRKNKNILSRFKEFCYSTFSQRMKPNFRTCYLTSDSKSATFLFIGTSNRPTLWNTRERRIKRIGKRGFPYHCPSSGSLPIANKRKLAYPSPFFYWDSDGRNYVPFRPLLAPNLPYSGTRWPARSR